MQIRFVVQSYTRLLFLPTLQTRTDFIQLMMNAHKEPNEQQDHDTEFNEMYKGTTRRSK